MASSGAAPCTAPDVSPQRSSRILQPVHAASTSLVHAAPLSTHCTSRPPHVRHLPIPTPRSVIPITPAPLLVLSSARSHSAPPPPRHRGAHAAHCVLPLKGGMLGWVVARRANQHPVRSGVPRVDPSMNTFKSTAPPYQVLPCCLFGVLSPGIPWGGGIP